MNAKKKAFLQAFEKSLGVITPACKAIGISRRTFYDWKEKDKVFKKAVEDLPEVALDFAEAQLYTQMKKGNTAATIFYLKTKGKKRGYTEQDQERDKNKDLFSMLPLEKRLELIKIITGK